MSTEFFFNFISSTGWLFFPLFMVGGVAWYLFVDIYSRLSGPEFHPHHLQKWKRWISLVGFYQKSKATLYERMAKHFYKHHLAEPIKKGELEGRRISSGRDFEKLIDDLFRGYHRNIHTVSVLAQVSPLLGLLGTVTGMMNTFEVISLYGNNNPILMADGISQAMLTTQIGLLIAFPLLLVVSRVKYTLRILKQKLINEFNTNNYR